VAAGRGWRVAAWRGAWRLPARVRVNAGRRTGKQLSRWPDACVGGLGIWGNQIGLAGLI